jgi:hypothetical protein
LRKYARSSSGNDRQRNPEFGIVQFAELQRRFVHYSRHFNHARNIF